jgi:hypothetical protein
MNCIGMLFEASFTSLSKELHALGKVCSATTYHFETTRIRSISLVVSICVGWAAVLAS